MYLLYDFVLFLFLLAMFPIYFVRSLLQGKLNWSVRERLGILDPELVALIRGRDVVWIHAASVGETLAALSLIKALRRSYPDSFLLLSTMTETGRTVASGIGELDGRILMPLDLSGIVSKYLERISPRFIVIVETEIWPNFLRIARKRAIPVIMANGRISDRSFPRYMRARFWVRPVLEKFTLLCMQAEKDAGRIRRMGAPGAAVEVTGNLKFDLRVSVPDSDETGHQRRTFHLPQERMVWVAGSTHTGEDEIIAGAYRKILQTGRDLTLILVPRHPERCRVVAQMLVNRGFSVRLRSRIEDDEELLQDGEILLVDTLGEMLKFYAVADVVFLGGSLVPLGGHNALEASALKKPVIFGPHMQNFKEISNLLLKARGAVGIAGEDDLVPAVARLLDDPKARETMGEHGYALLQRNAGATQRTLEAIRRATER